MKLFDSLFKRPGTVVIGLHFAKTGGTSVQAHAVQHFEDRFAFHGYGPRANTERLFAGERLLEEYSDDELRRVRFVFGHGVNADVPALFPRGSVRLFTVCRDPFDRFVSGFKHHLRAAKSGDQLDARAFFDQYAPNPFANAVFEGFGAYANGAETVNEAGLRETLRNFELILSTEHLDAQSPALFGPMGLPPLSMRKRVYPETPDLGDLKPEDIYGRDDLDTMVDKSVNAFFEKNPDAGGDTLNPFGFDARRRDSHCDRVRRELGRETLIDRAYDRLFDQLRDQERLVAAERYLSLRDPNAVLPRLRRYCTANGIALEEDALSGNGFGYLGEALLRAGRVEDARDVLHRGIERYPGSVLSLHVLAQSYWRSEDWQRVAEYSRRAVDLNAMHTRSLVLLGRALVKLDQLAEARETLRRVVDLEPSRHKAAQLLADVETRLGG
jgi:tetratricopeptide (TPR) repeat protein